MEPISFDAYIDRICYSLFCVLVHVSFLKWTEIIIIMQNVFTISCFFRAMVCIFMDDGI